MNYKLITQIVCITVSGLVACSSFDNDKLTKNAIFFHPVYGIVEISENFLEFSFYNIPGIKMNRTNGSKFSSSSPNVFPCMTNGPFKGDVVCIASQKDHILELKLTPMCESSPFPAKIKYVKLGYDRLNFDNVISMRCSTNNTVDGKSESKEIDITDPLNIKLDSSSLSLKEQLWIIFYGNANLYSEQMTHCEDGCKIKLFINNYGVLMERSLTYQAPDSPVGPLYSKLVWELNELN